MELNKIQAMNFSGQSTLSLMQGNLLGIEGKEEKKEIFEKIAKKKKLKKHHGGKLNLSIASPLSKHHSENEAPEITGEIETYKGEQKIGVDAQVGMPKIDIPKPLIYIGAGIGILIIGGIIWRIVKH